MEITLTHYLLEAVDKYIQGEWPVQPPISVSSKLTNQWNRSQTDDQRATCLAQVIQHTVVGLNTLERMDMLRELSRHFHQVKDSLAKERMKLLKTALQPTSSSHQQSVNWKHHLLGTTLSCQHHLFFTPLQVSFDAQQSIANNPERFKAFSGGNDTLRSHAIAGSSFTTNRAQYLTENMFHVLDAYCSAYTYDKAGQANGVILAIADGCGGHFGDVHQDRMISRAAHFASKHAVRLFSLYSKPTLLLNALADIVQDIAAEVTLKAGGESTTLLCVRAFQIESGYHLVGFNLGDCALLGWNPSQQRCQTLAPAHVSSAGTAGIPGFYKSWEIHPIDIKIEAGCFLVPMTDGMVDGLPTIATESIYPNQLSYRTISFQEEAIAALLGQTHAVASAEDYLQRLMQYALTKLDEERVAKQESQEEIQLGDDIILGVLPLPLTAVHQNWTHTVAKWWSKTWDKMQKPQEAANSFGKK